MHLRRLTGSLVLLSLVLFSPIAIAATFAWKTQPAQQDTGRDAAQVRDEAELKPLKVLFLGDRGHHRPRAMYQVLQPVLAEREIALDYTRDMGDINADNLKNYNALLVFANIDAIDPEPAKAILDYVAGGGGFVPLHCASFCFRNSDELVKLIGGQFLRHGTGTFSTTISKPDHPVMQGFGGFESWDETYVHHKHNEENRDVLSHRVDGDEREPWTWVRTHEKGRVFYTAWGHDERTWENPGFQNLVERGIRWAAGDDPSVVPDFGENTQDGNTPFPVPEMTKQRKDVEPFEYIDVGPKIPNYRPGAAWGTQDEPRTMMQKPLSPEESLKHIVTPVGFHVELFASEPDLGGKPICMAWDERGRLWLAETYDYPNEMQRDGAGRDRIRICEDTDGDGRADKFTVFAEELSIPTTLTFARGGLIVQNARETLFLKDTDGDDVADERQVLFTGWAMGDTHGGVSNFRYGLDNWIWAMQGYNNSAPVVNGERQPVFRQGFFRFKPDGSELEFLRSTDNNTWGLGLSEAGIVFGSTANRNPSVYMPIPNRYYEGVRGWRPSLVLRMISDTYRFDPITENVRQVDQHGGYTAGAGHALYTAREYPQEYWNRVAFVNGPTGHLVGAFVIDSEGADYHTTSPFNLFASDDEWTAPIAAEVGPDGNVWVLDWYNYIVQHNPTPRGFETGRGNAYETDLRDKKHGRIYRVVYHGEDETWEPTPASPISLANATPEKLVETLAHDTMLWRLHAQRLLVERGETDVVPQLIALVADQSTDATGLNAGAVHALQTLHGLGVFAEDRSRDSAHAATVALAHPSYAVRRTALQVIPRNATSANAIVTSGLLMDDHPQVRLAAFLTLAEMPCGEKLVPAIVRAAADPINREDRWIPDAVTALGAHLAPSFLQSITSAEGLNARLIETVNVVAGHFARTRAESENAAAETAVLLTNLRQAPPGISQAIIAGLSEGWPEELDDLVTPEIEASLTNMAEDMPVAAQANLIRLGRKMGSSALDEYADAVADDLLGQVGNEGFRWQHRIDAAQQLVQFLPDDAATMDKLLDLITPRTEPNISQAIVLAVGEATAPEAGESLIAMSPRVTPNLRADIMAVLLRRTDWTRQLLTALESGDVQLADLTLDQRQRLANHRDRRIRRTAAQILERGGALPSPDRQQVLLEMLAAVETEGDADAGRAIFEKTCAKCHMHNGKGTAIGPDLTGMAVHPKEHLLTEILDPNRSLEGNFRTYIVATEDGRVLNGLLAAESRTAIELFDVEGKKHTVLREDIDEMESTGKSLMPEGFEKQLTKAEITDLLQFLTARGKYLPLDLRKVATIASDRGMFNSTEATAERLIFSDWSPKTHNEIPFVLVDPQNGRVPNVVLLNGPSGQVSAQMPRRVELPVNAPAAAIHMLSGVGGWSYPYNQDETVSMTVRLHYADGESEDHDLRNGVHFADYIRRVDVEESEFAFSLRGQQIRYLAIEPERDEVIERLELIKGGDRTAPVVMAITVEGRE